MLGEEVNNVICDFMKEIWGGKVHKLSIQNANLKLFQCMQVVSYYLSYTF